jgi:hypothetical protein
MGGLTVVGRCNRLRGAEWLNAMEKKSGSYGTYDGNDGKWNATSDPNSSRYDSNP